MKFRLDESKQDIMLAEGGASTFWVSKSSDEEVWTSVQGE